MAKYDYLCARCARKFELDRPIAQRAEKALCPHCGKLGATLLFSPTRFIGVPRALHTRWSDIAPIGKDGHPMEYHEATKDKRFDRYDPTTIERAMAEHEASEKRKEPIIRKRAAERARRKVEARRKVRV